ncbi:hypothetical protein RIF23_04785 [Lipingzhangella sp. LS1_29]|uniref:ABC transporter ATP-binding protein n=1 Tax=Lipingzhangella rawalii TaxID=2055835 RepID=A0ABU2H2S6_9ACTN|nr:hypothetical protein [Lipingzhangella rawalii]MDS1269605.1 hypothetical protein [Lipingzhangella rawalii]
MSSQTVEASNDPAPVVQLAAARRVYGTGGNEVAALDEVNTGFGRNHH